MDWERLIAERNEWVAHNFPDNKLPRPQETTLGLIEEIGELAHSHLKELQNIRGTAEEHQANAKDAVGDATVYLLGVLSFHGVVPDESRLPTFFIAKLDSPQGCIFQASKWAGQVGELTNEFSAERKTGRIAVALRSYCQLRGWDYEQIVTETWAKVSKRDWIENPQDGNEGPNHETLEQAADRLRKADKGE